MRLIDADALLDAYDKAHEGPPGAARMLIEDAPTVCGWISVKDRLPETNGQFLCYSADYPLGAFISTQNFNVKKGAFWWYEDNVKVPFITHWMPLPEPPKEVEP